MEQDIYSIKQSNSSFKEGETCNRFDTSNLHNNDKFVEQLKGVIQLKGVMEQNKTAIANLETVCQSSSNDTAYIELHTLRKEYELICSENAILKKENAEYLER
jgi:outer membrane lipopolysaccharide assembly protein LptE/RlpB